jgi:photosystem II stability/assembly factor-like uncharacterized protein
MYKSTDAGKTWRHLGLDSTRQIGKVAVDPRNPDVVFVAALGHVYGANPDRGVYRSRDGGATWQKVLFKSNGRRRHRHRHRSDRSADDLCLALEHPSSAMEHLSAFVRHGQRPPTNPLMAERTGSSCRQGLPTDGLGRIGIAIAPANRSRIYAIVDAKEGGLYRSDDGGARFTKVSSDARIWGRGWYFGKVTVDPKNADLVYVSNTGVYRSRDGGKTFGEPFKGSPGGDDYHQLWIYPDDGNIMILGGDQGAVISVEGLNEHPTWSSWINQPIAQIYRLAVDNSFPYWVTGAQQDSGAVRVRSRGRFANITMRDWEPLCAGGEAGYTAPDPLNPDIVYGGHGGEVQRADGADRTHITGSRSADAAAPHVDAAARLLARGSEGALFQRSVSLQDDRRRQDVDADQRRHDARESRRAAESRRRHRGRRA